MTNDTKRPDDTAAAAAEPSAAKSSAAPDDAATVAGGPADVEIATLKAQIADLTDRLLRAHAEMDNIRKRGEREKADTQKYAVTKFAHDVITVGDNVERAIAAVPARAAEQDPALKSFLEGVRMTERELINVLERHGIKRMNPQGEAFNPHHHQAVMESHDESVPAGTVVQVLQAGYTIEDRTLRPAMVAVAKGGAKPTRQTEAAGDAAPTAANDDSPDQFGTGPIPPRSEQSNT
jgi:molecular chaperone GrpE